jgi:hypothetical protein
MIHELGSLKPKLAKGEYRRPLKNPAVAHCQKTWERVYRSVQKEKNSGALARIEASEAYRAAMPLLLGHKNIRDFIACVTFGFASGILFHDITTKLLYAAQVALKVETQKPKTGAKKASPKSSKSCGLISLTTKHRSKKPLFTVTENKGVSLIGPENKGVTDTQNGQKQAKNSHF